MKNLFYKIACLFFVFGSYCPGSFAQAPPWAWARDAGGPGNDLGYSVSANDIGSVFITGRFNDVCQFGNNSVTSFGGPDIFIARYDANGNCIWATHAGSTNLPDVYGDVGYGVATDPFGNCYVTGNFITQATFGSFTLSCPFPKKEIFVVKYDSTGNAVWAEQATGSSATNYSRGIAVDSAGNSYITCYLGNGNNTFGPYTLSGPGAYVVKYDSSGAVMYATKLGTLGAFQAYGISIDHSGNAFVAGYFGDPDSINGQLFTCSSYQDAFIIKVDAVGNFLWLVKSTSIAPNRAYGQSVAADAQGNVLFTGQFGNVITFGNITLSNSFDSSAFFVAKYDSNGNFLWARQNIPIVSSYPNPIGNSIVTDNSSNAYITGMYRDAISFGNCGLPNNGLAAFVVKYDLSGNCQWATGSAGGNTGATGYGISHNNSGECYITGYDKAPPVFGSTTLQSHGGEDIFLAKLNESTGVAEQNMNSDFFRIFPNPATGSIQLTINTKYNAPLECEIINMMGERVFTSPLASLQRSGEAAAQVDVSFLAKGIYMVRVSDVKSFENKKLVIE